jgi:hypothetical protein
MSTRRLICSEGWEFCAEGNANLIYRYVGIEDEYRDRLLRLRKESQTLTTKEVYDYMNRVILKIIGCAVNMELVEVDFKKEEALDDGHGLLMPYLLKDTEVMKKERYFTVHQGNEITVIEIKPKWLSKTKFGCRNCAHHRFKHGSEPQFCSRDLIRSDKVHHAVQLIVNNQAIQSVLEGYLLSEESIFKKLAQLQDHDLSFEDIDNEAMIENHHCLQMTLRDVTVFLKVNDSRVLDVVITDLDPKSRVKWSHWKHTEQSLINYYRSSCRASNLPLSDAHP